MAVLTLVMCGGLSDRIGCLLSGVYLKQKHDCSLRLVWDINSSCMARYDELFENDFGEVIHTDNVLYENRRPSIRDNFFFNSNLSVIPKDRIYHGKFPPWDWLTRQYKLPQNDWLLFTNCFLPMIPEIKRGELISLLKPLSAITQEVDKFCIRYNITQKTIGAHLRLTDTGDSGTLDNCKKQITELISQNSKARIFLCSDDEESAREIQSMYPKHIIVRPNRECCQKLNADAGWMESPDEQQFYNINRSPQAVIDGLIDFYVLTRTTIRISTKGSGFYNDAKRLSSYNRTQSSLLGILTKRFWDVIIRG